MTLEEARGVLRREVRHDDHPRDADFYCPRSNDDLVWDDPDTPCTCGASERADEFTRLLALLDALPAEVARLRGLLKRLEWARGTRYGHACPVCGSAQHEDPGYTTSGPDHGHFEGCELRAALSRWEEVSGG
jgi:hypothetical protein